MPVLPLQKKRKDIQVQSHNFSLHTAIKSIFLMLKSRSWIISAPLILAKKKKLSQGTEDRVTIFSESLARCSSLQIICSSDTDVRPQMVCCKQQLQNVKWSQESCGEYNYLYSRLVC